MAATAEAPKTSSKRRTAPNCPLKGAAPAAAAAAAPLATAVEDDNDDDAEDQPPDPAEAAAAAAAIAAASNSLNAPMQHAVSGSVTFGKRRREDAACSPSTYSLTVAAESGGRPGECAMTMNIQRFSCRGEARCAASAQGHPFPLTSLTRLIRSTCEARSTEL